MARGRVCGPEGHTNEKEENEMRQICKRSLSLALCLLLCAALLPGAVWAEEIVASGTCGENLTWTLDSAGKLTISGTGEMEDYDWNSFPWYGKRSSVFTVEIRSGVTSVGDSAFNYCDSLTSVSIPNSVTSIGNEAFEFCHSLTSVTIPNSVTSIGYYAFSDCTSLTSVTIPDSVTSIGGGAFSDCNSLTSISIPNSVTSMGGFLRCSSLTSITIPNSITSIGNGEFSWCSSLTSVTIPNSVTSIGDVAFLDCNSLTDIYFTGTEREWKAIEIGEYNDPLLSAAVHFNSTGPSVVLSPQNLTVNGVSQDVEKYNIDGYNYFKLRDIAYLLNGTPAQFSVEWDAAANAARIVSGQPYTANGSELVIGADRSATAVRSPQTIVIDGEVRSDLAAFNLAGNNFFKLRDLSEALGFQVDYDAATNTAVVTTG